MKTVRQIARSFGISRATLLYYDRIGLLRPFHRTAAGHRLYGPEDEDRLARIRELRGAGMALDEIDAVLEPDARFRSSLDDALHRRLSELNREITALRRQQQVVLDLLKQPGLARHARIMTKEAWVALLAAAGMDDDDRTRWHREFERVSPEAHQDFLESLGIDAGEIRQIRAWSARPLKPQAEQPAPAHGARTEPPGMKPATPTRVRKRRHQENTTPPRRGSAARPPG